MTAPALDPLTLPEMTLNCEVRESGCTGRAEVWLGAHPEAVTCGEKFSCTPCLKFLRASYLKALARNLRHCEVCGRWLTTWHADITERPL